MAALSECKFRAQAETIDAARDVVLAAGFQTLAEFIRVTLEDAAATRTVPAMYIGRQSRIRMGRPRKLDRNAMSVRQEAA